MNWSDYLPRIEQEIAATETRLAGGTAGGVLQQYLDTLKMIRDQYRDSTYAPKLDDAYRQLDEYIDHYLGLLTTANAAAFNRAAPNIILYLGDRSALRRFPQAQIYLISVRSEDVNADPRVWTSLAHELGHFVYWNSEFAVSKGATMADVANNSLFFDDLWEALSVTSDDMNFTKPDNAVPPADLSKQQVITAFVSAWSEEIFADTLGVFLAGEEYFTQAKNFYLKSLAADGEKRFVDDDNDHPIPFLRPFIAAKALEAVTGESNTLWKTFKDEIRAQYLDAFLGKIGAVTGSGIPDDEIQLSVEFDDGTGMQIPLGSIKSTIVAAIAFLAAKIRTSKLLDRPNEIFMFIEEFDNPAPPNPLIETRKGIAAWLARIRKLLKRK